MATWLRTWSKEWAIGGGAGRARRGREGGRGEEEKGKARLKMKTVGSFGSLPHIFSTHHRGQKSDSEQPQKHTPDVFCFFSPRPVSFIHCVGPSFRPPPGLCVRSRPPLTSRAERVPAQGPACVHVSLGGGRPPGPAPPCKLLTRRLASAACAGASTPCRRCFRRAHEWPTPLPGRGRGDVWRAGLPG